MTSNNQTSRYLGCWNICIRTRKDTIDDLNHYFFENIDSQKCSYSPLAYLGKQCLGSNIFSGNNHAILAKQVIHEDGTIRIIVAIFNNEGPQAISIERILEGYLEPQKYDIVIEPSITIPDDAYADFESVMKNFVDLIIEPFVYLGYQNCAKGVNKFFAAEVTALDVSGKKDIALITVNAEENTFFVNNILF